MHHKRWLSGILLSVALPVLSQAQNTNFPLSFPPALYPLANSGKLDGAITGLGGVMSVPGPSVKFGGVAVTVRQPFNSVFAMDMVLGGAGLSTSIPDGVTPITVSYANWGHTIPFGYQANGAGNLSGTVLNAALDLEFRPLNTRAGGLTLFGGPVLQYLKTKTSGSYYFVDPPYYASADALSGPYSDSLTVEGTLYGLQYGAQCGLNLSNAIGLTPFAMGTITRGSLFVYDNIGAILVDSLTGAYIETPETRKTVTIDSQFAGIIGADLIIWPLDVSIGVFIQKTKPNGGDTVDTKGLRASWYFGNNGYSRHDARRNRG